MAILYPTCIGGGPCNAVCLFLRTVGGERETGTRKIYEWLRRLLLLRLSLPAFPFAIGFGFGGLGWNWKGNAPCLAFLFCCFIWLFSRTHAYDGYVMERNEVNWQSKGLTGSVGFGGWGERLWLWFLITGANWDFFFFFFFFFALFSVSASVSVSAIGIENCACFFFLSSPD